jgi:hypothetical protein
MTRAGTLLAAILVQGVALPAEPIAVRQMEGVLHGFLTLSTLDGNAIADGDVVQVVHGDQVTCRLSFRFRDGSRSDETTVYSQRGHFRLVSDRLLQQGPMFPHPMDVSIDGRSGRTAVHYKDDDGHDKALAEHVDLPSDAANGMILTLLKNIQPAARLTTVSMVAATPKLRTVKLEIRPVGEEPLSIGSTAVKALHYVVKVDIGGLSGLLAPFLGKQPPDLHAWILMGEAPAFVKLEAPLYLGGPVWRVELVSPVWPKVAESERK